MPTHRVQKNSDRRLLTYPMAGLRAAEIYRLATGPDANVRIAPMATPTTNRILQNQQPLEILRTESGPAEPRRRTLRTNHRVYPLTNSPEYRRNVARMKDT
jgi:hypothetical protein